MMDPRRANIERQRLIARKIIDDQDAGEDHEDVAVELAELVLALDEWCHEAAARLAAFLDENDDMRAVEDGMADLYENDEPQ